MSDYLQDAADMLEFFERTNATRQRQAVALAAALETAHNGAALWIKDFYVMRDRLDACDAACAKLREESKSAEERGRRRGVEERDELQTRVGRWVRVAFTEDALTDRWERAARVVEEAIELAQAEGLDHEDVYRLLKRVYARPAGAVEQEAGGIMVCLLAWAEGRETSLAACALREVERIETPQAIEKIRRKQSEKAASGTGHDYASTAALAPRDSAPLSAKDHAHALDVADRYERGEFHCKCGKPLTAEHPRCP